ncbi:hypothetical protein PVAND_001584 [Polypedilum vanderplanki]|uniref:Gustatory receptor n=1 Tax=Polypedilum vanderplanki TaxID=319348 RepID=A0A9J6BNU3_POLVA|nr:hypothetical protein PVAND_001584 [Polypedilum vanderplanki]
MEQKKKIIRVDKELHRCLYFFEILGLQYFSLRSLWKETKSPENPTILRGVYLFVILIILTALMVNYILADTDSMAAKVTAKNVLTYTVKNSMKIGMLVVLLVSGLQSFISTKNVKRIFINIQRLIDITDAEFDATIDFNVIRNNVKRNTAAVIIFFFLTHGSILVYVSTSSLEQALTIFMSSPPIIFILATTFKFTLFVKIINCQLTFLKTLIEGIFNTQKVKFIEFDMKIIPVRVASKSPSESFKKFISAKKIYNLIYENAGLVNDSMGFTVLIILIVHVIALTASGYQLFVILVEQKMRQNIPETCYTITLGLAMLISMVTVCQKTQKIMTELATVVSKIECDNYEQLTDESREFVHKFYMQLNHQPVLFTAYGFYTINLALLASILTGIISYQIILIQFYAA